jgi:hypothetical protein|tara:strand:- start:55 stop:387 length:333 start_codon:yes stop_codon:yes gene_type:complete
LADKSDQSENEWESQDDVDNMDNTVFADATGSKKRRGRNTNCNSDEAQKRRLEKNRESAKESRKRKKQYMSNLEIHNRTLLKEKAKLMRKINALEERERLNYLSHVDTVD